MFFGVFCLFVVFVCCFVFGAISANVHCILNQAMLLMKNRRASMKPDSDIIPLSSRIWYPNAMIYHLSLLLVGVILLQRNFLLFWYIQVGLPTSETDLPEAAEGWNGWKWNVSRLVAGCSKMLESAKWEKHKHQLANMDKQKRFFENVGDCNLEPLESFGTRQNYQGPVIRSMS